MGRGEKACRHAAVQRDRMQRSKRSSSMRPTVFVSAVPKNRAPSATSASEEKKRANANSSTLASVVPRQFVPGFSQTKALYVLNGLVRSSSDTQEESISTSETGESDVSGSHEFELPTKKNQSDISSEFNILKSSEQSSTSGRRSPVSTPWSSGTTRHTGYLGRCFSNLSSVSCA